MGNRMIEAHNLGQEYGGRSVLRDINLKVKSGEVFALIGPTGAGKTTLLRLLDLLEVPAQGKVYFDGTDVTSIRQERLRARRRMSFVQQKPVVFTMSVFDNAACGLKWRREEDELIRRRVDAALELVGMTEYGDRNAKTLSGGETQRVAIARALATQPELLLLDEPTVHLDITHQIEILELVRGLNVERGLTVIAAMHDLNLASLYFDRLILLKEGRISAEGTPAQVLTEDTIREVFSASVRVEPHPATGVPHIVVMPKGSTAKLQ